MKAKPKAPAPDDLTRDEQMRLWNWVQGKAHPTHRAPDPFFLQLVRNRKLLRYHVDACLEWHRNNEVKRSDFVQACQNWITKTAIEAEERRTSEKPQEQARRGSVGAPLSSVLSDTIEMFRQRGAPDEPT